MNSDASKAETGLEVRTYFVRGRNALARPAPISANSIVDYYLHQGQHGYQHEPAHDGLLKQALAAITLHAPRVRGMKPPPGRSISSDPLLNLFVTGDNRLGTVVGQIFTENVKQDEQQLFIADVVRERAESRRSAVEFEGTDIFRAVEQYYAQSEQRPGALFPARPRGFRLRLGAAAVRSRVARVAR